MIGNLPWTLALALAVASAGFLAVAVFIVFGAHRDNERVRANQRSEAKPSAVSSRSDSPQESAAPSRIHTDEHEAMGEYDLLAAIRMTNHNTDSAA